MFSLSFLAAGFFIKAMAFIWVLCALALIFIVLIQKGKGGGLSGAFGGGMASSVLGANTKKPLTWFTIGLVSLFLLIAVLLAKFYRPGVSGTGAPQPASRTQPVQTGQEQPAVPLPETKQPVEQALPAETTAAGSSTSEIAADTNAN